MFDREDLDMTDEGPILGAGWTPLAAVIILGVGLFVGYKTLRIDTRVGAAIMIGSVIPAALVIWQYIRLRVALGDATLTIKSKVVPLGWSGMATYLRALNGASVRTRPPSFKTTDNEIIWWVRLHLKMDGCPNTRSSFRVPVVPAVEER